MYRQIGLSVTIVTTYNFLVDQYRQILGSQSWSINFMTMLSALTKADL